MDSKKTQQLAHALILETSDREHFFSRKDEDTTRSHERALNFLRHEASSPLDHLNPLHSEGSPSTQEPSAESTGAYCLLVERPNAPVFPGLTASGAPSAPLEPRRAIPLSPHFEKPSASDTASRIRNSGHSGSNARPALDPHLAFYAPTLITLIRFIKEEMRRDPRCLLSLNPSRRRSLCEHLEFLSQWVRPGTSGTTLQQKRGEDPRLQHWIEGPLSPAQSNALETYFDEVALFYLGQVIVLKRWHDQGIRKLVAEDLSRLSPLAYVLQTLLPNGVEPWELSRQNLYSWYRPSAAIQREIFQKICAWDLQDEPHNFLERLSWYVYQRRKEWPEFEGYDSRFFDSIWNHLAVAGFDFEAPQNGFLKRELHAFSPTLRDGTLARSAPESLRWIGTERYPFLLYLAEFSALWRGPRAAPLWLQSTGLEVHPPQEQLSFLLGQMPHQPKSRIAEMEACDFAFVLEERPIRLHDRTPEGIQLKEALDALPFYQSIAEGNTSLGTLQVVLSLTKLRPGGLLFWFRETPIQSSEGAHALRSILERAKLLGEWDLSKLEVNFPTESRLHPRYLYLLQREKDPEEIRNHVPVRIGVFGSLRSHVEVPLVFEDLLNALHGNLSQRSTIKIHRLVSPEPQSEWIERWPDPSNEKTLAQLDRLRENASYLGQFVSIRSVTKKELLDSACRPDGGIQALWLYADQRSLGRRLRVKYRERVKRRSRSSSLTQEGSNGYLLFVRDSQWAEVLCEYLQSDLIAAWLDHYAERRHGKWNLNEKTLKSLPIPKILSDIVERRWVDSEILNICDRLEEEPLPVLSVLENMAGEIDHSPARALIFVEAARARARIEKGSARLFSLMSRDHQIFWPDFMQVIPPQQKTSLETHPLLRFTGALPGDLPIDSTVFETGAHGAREARFSTDSGFSLIVRSKDALLMEIFEAYISGAKHPTWNELRTEVELPLSAQQSRAMADEIMKSFHRQKHRLEVLDSVLKLAADF